MSTSSAPLRRRVVAVVGNAAPSPAAANEARLLGRLIVEEGWRLVSGGLGGIMSAASRGAHEAKGYREGDVVGILPGSEASAANEWVDIVVPTNLGFARNTLVVSMADAVVAVGGGAGTLTEIAMAWQLGKPLVALELDGWSGKLAGRTIDDRDRPPIIAAANASAAVRAVARVLEPG